METGQFTSFEQGLQAFNAWFDLLEQGTYFSVMHPARASREMLLCRNERVPIGVVVTGRDVEYQLLLSQSLEQACEARGIQRLRYDEAESQDATIQSLRDHLGSGRKEGIDGQKR
jgi:hypothetical protein